MALSTAALRAARMVSKSSKSLVILVMEACRASNSGSTGSRVGASGTLRSSLAAFFRALLNDTVRSEPSTQHFTFRQRRRGWNTSSFLHRRSVWSGGAFCGLCCLPGRHWWQVPVLLALEGTPFLMRIHLRGRGLRTFRSFPLIFHRHLTFYTATFEHSGCGYGHLAIFSSITL